MWAEEDALVDGRQPHGPHPGHRRAGVRGAGVRRRVRPRALRRPAVRPQRRGRVGRGAGVPRAARAARARPGGDAAARAADRPEHPAARAGRSSRSRPTGPSPRSARSSTSSSPPTRRKTGTPHARRPHRPAPGLRRARLDEATSEQVTARIERIRGVVRRSALSARPRCGPSRFGQFPARRAAGVTPCAESRGPGGSMRLGALVLQQQPWLEARRRGAGGAARVRRGYAADHLTHTAVAGRWWADGWTTLAAAAGVTDRLMLGTLVASAAVRSATVLARSASTLQDISGGRFVLAWAPGWLRRPRRPGCRAERRRTCGSATRRPCRPCGRCGSAPPRGAGGASPCTASAGRRTRPGSCRPRSCSRRVVRAGSTSWPSRATAGSPTAGRR